MKRLGNSNKAILAKFAKFAELKNWPAHFVDAKKLQKDRLFPKVQIISIDTYGHYYQVEKRNGKWQIQRVDFEGQKAVSAWMGTRKFETMLDNVITIQEIEKRDQGD